MSNYSDISELDELDVLEYPEGTEYQLVDRYAREALPGKQNTLTAGSRINITGNTISAESEIDDESATQTNTWSAKKLGDNYVTQEQVNSLLQAQATQVQEALNIGSDNLIPYPYTETTKTVNGVTFTDNGDRSITIQGTPTANTKFYLAGTNIVVSDFMIPKDSNYRLDYKNGRAENVGLEYNVYEPTDQRYNQMSRTFDTMNFNICNDNITSDPVPCVLTLLVSEGVQYDITVYPELFDTTDESNMDIQHKLTAGPGISLDSNDLISAKIDSDTIEFNSDSELAVASEITSEIGSLSLQESEHTSEIHSLSLQGSQHTSELASMSTSMSQLASTASSLSAENSLQTSEISSLSTAESELASELDGKQNSLTAGSGISIANDVISATGGGGGGKQLIGEVTRVGTEPLTDLMASLFTYLLTLDADQLAQAEVIMWGSDSLPTRLMLGYAQWPATGFRWFCTFSSVFLFGSATGSNLNQYVLRFVNPSATTGSAKALRIDYNTSSNALTNTDISSQTTVTKLQLYA